MSTSAANTAGSVPPGSGRAWTVPGYTEVRVLGGGGFGEVVLATHDVSGRPVAIKYLHPDLLRDSGHAAGFRAEARTLAALDSPHVVRLYEYVEGPAGAAIVMELVEGVTLAGLLEREGKTTPEAALVVLYGSLLGLAAAHARGVVHRDYKPANVLVDGQGVSKLTDFGIAALAGGRPVPAGTLRYMPPEQFEGAAASPAADVYAATVTFYQCLAGRVPFDGKTAQELYDKHKSAPVPLDEIPEPLRPVIARGLAKDARIRPSDAGALAAELREAATEKYGEGWEDRGRSHLAEAAVALLALLWPSGGSSAAASSAMEHVQLTDPARNARPPQSAHPGQPAQATHAAQAGQPGGSSGQADETEAEHLHHIEHLEHAEHLDHVEHVEHEEHLEHLEHEEHLAHLHQLNGENGGDRHAADGAHPGENRQVEQESSAPAAAAGAVDVLANWAQSLLRTVSRSNRSPHWLRRILPRDPRPRMSLAIVAGAIGMVIVLIIAIAVAATGSTPANPAPAADSNSAGLGPVGSVSASLSAGATSSTSQCTGTYGTAALPVSAASLERSVQQVLKTCDGVVVSIACTTHGDTEIYACTIPAQEAQEVHMYPFSYIGIDLTTGYWVYNGVGYGD
jgi:protein kinase-like protein